MRARSRCQPKRAGLQRLRQTCADACQAGRIHVAKPPPHGTTLDARLPSCLCRLRLALLRQAGKNNDNGGRTCKRSIQSHFQLLPAAGPAFAAGPKIRTDCDTSELRGKWQLTRHASIAGHLAAEPLAKGDACICGTSTSVAPLPKEAAQSMPKHLVREAYAILVILGIIALTWVAADVLTVTGARLVH
jgi:hypothetical protein